jgi:hypothetical protein
MKTFPRAVALVLGLAMLCSTFPNSSRAESYEEKTETILADVIVYRPAGVVLTAAGTGLFLLVLPFSAIVGGTRSTGHTLVKTPFNFTFRRPIGTDLRDYVDY